MEQWKSCTYFLWGTMIAADTMLTAGKCDIVFNCFFILSCNLQSFDLVHTTQLTALMIII